MARRIYTETDFAHRAWPALPAMMLACIHIYGLGDYPDHIVQIAQVWLIPVALAIIADRAPARTMTAPPAGLAAPHPADPRHQP